ncbi:SMC-Scp complex subunit ScpB [Luminiphilus sp. nBUS_07]|uniref:SMC-Scp complex subunit ScpB n=1 Tax=Luminiphilus sp. nBUS_07 TaxID=3395314 RepID=UPI003EBCE2D6
MAETGLVQILEGALMVAGEALSIQRLSQLFDEFDRPANTDLREALEEVGKRCEGRGYELVQVATGYRFQVRQNLSTWVGRLWQERPPRYSRALLETLSLIAYRQPITRGEIEEIRGVAVSTNIIKTLQERDWVRIVGHRDVPGRPAMYATTRQFLDYFNLKSLEELPPLAEIKDLENLSGDLPLEILEVEAAAANDEGSDAATADNDLAAGIAESESEEEAEAEAPEGTLDEPSLADQATGEASLEEDASVGEALTAEVPLPAASEDHAAAEKTAAVEETSDQSGSEQPSGAEQASSESHSDGELLDEQSPAPAK